MDNEDRSSLRKQWFCENCRKTNFYNLEECRICRGPRNTENVFWTWKCRCGKINRDDHVDCRDCGKSGPEEVRRTTSRRSPSPERAPKRARSPSPKKARSRSPERAPRNRCTWECQSCGNWSSHHDYECLKCDGPKFNH